MEEHKGVPQTALKRDLHDFNRALPEDLEQSAGGPMSDKTFIGQNELRVILTRLLTPFLSYK